MVGNRANGQEPGQYEVDPIRRDKYGARVFRVLLGLVPIIVVLLIVWRVIVSDRTMVSTPGPAVTKVEQNENGVVTTTTYYTSTASLGAFDPSLGADAWLAQGILILVVGSAVELALIVWYGSYYLGTPGSKTSLALPIGTVRVFLILLVLITLLLLTLLPASWSENRAASSFVNLFVAVVGFYFGNASATDRDQANKESNRSGNTDESKKSTGSGTHKGNATAKVTKIMPAEAVLGESGYISIRGKGFTPSAVKDMKLDFSPSGGVHAEKLTYRSETLLRAQFKVKDDAVPGDYTLTISMPDGPVGEATFEVIDK